MYSSVTDRLDKLYMCLHHRRHVLPIGLFQTFVAFADFQSTASSENVDIFSIPPMAIDGCVDTTPC